MKKILALVLVLTLVFTLAGCGKEEELFNIGKSESIEIQLGQTGQKVIIADRDFIDNITNNINSLKYVKTSSCEDETAYEYKLTWLGIDESPIGEIVISEVNGYQIHYDGDCYKVADDLNIDTDIIAEQVNICLSSAPAPENVN